MNNILVTGAKGQVGSELAHLSSQYPQFQFYFTDLPELDLTDSTALSALFAETSFQYCINCAAYTAVDQAESEPELAKAVNETAVAALARICVEYHTGLIQLSSDYVYHNSLNRPLRPEDPCQPKSVYAQTKLSGDAAALSLNPQSMVIRTSWVYSSFGHNFVKTMLRLGASRDSLGIIYDQIGAPTYARDLAKAILDILSQFAAGQKKPADFSGIYHYSNEGVCSWYDFALAIFDVSEIDCNVSAIETKDYPTPAARPPFSLLEKSAIKADFGLKIPYWRDSLKQCLNTIRVEIQGG